MRTAILIILPLLSSSLVIRSNTKLAEPMEKLQQRINIDDNVQVLQSDDVNDAESQMDDDDDVVIQKVARDDDGGAILGKADDDVVSKVDDDVTNETDDDDDELVNGLTCHKCPPGYGLVTVCDARQQTVCEPCVAGANYTASDDDWHFRPCQPCSRCGVNMYVETACTPMSDTFCDACDGVLASRRRNEDFERKCLYGVDGSSSFESKENDESAEFEQLSQNIESVFGKNVRTLLNESKNGFSKPLNVNSAQPRIVIDSVDVDLVQAPENDHSKEIGRLEIQLLPDPLARVHAIWQNAPISKNKKERSGIANGSPTTINAFSNSVTPLPVSKLPQFDDWLSSRPEDFLSKKTNNADEASDSLENSKKNIVYKPSSHSYPYADLLHASEFTAFHLKQHRKLIVLLIILLSLLSLILFALVLLRKQSKLAAKRRRIAFAADLSDFDSKIIKECAKKLEQSVKRGRKQKSGRYNPFSEEKENTSSGSSLQVVENPLLNYLEENTQSLNERLICESNKKPGITDV